MHLTIEGETFRVEIEGAENRPAVLLSPSLGSDLTLFDAQMPALLEHFRVVRYDPRGHGGSTIAGPPYALARLGRDALAILDALGIATTHFIGISMGGAVGQWLLVNAPGRIERAVLANTAARIGAPETWNARIADVLAHGTQAIAGATMERWFSPAFRKSAPEIVAAIETVFRETSNEGYAGACAALRDMDLREAISAIERPVLIVTGRDDPVTSEADIAHLERTIRGARHVELDCRHVSNIEQSIAFDAAVVAFLTGPVSARAGRASRQPSRRRTAGRTSAARSPLKPAEPKDAKAAAKPAAKPAARARATPAKTARRAARGAVAKATVKATARKAAAKKGAVKKAAAKKSSRKPAAGRPARKAVAVRATPRKAATRPAASKKTVTKKSAARTTTKKVAPTKPASNKTSPTKAASAKAAPNKTLARRTAATRRAAPKRPGRPGGRQR